VFENVKIKTYFKEVFEPKTIEQAMNVCLTSDVNDSNKFVNETKFLVDFLKEQQLIQPATKVLDFGCGVGRVSKALIQEIGCEVVGFDISDTMLKYAIEYVNNNKFIPVVYDKNMSTLDKPKFDLIIASLVLQHSEHPLHDINVMKCLLNDGGRIVIINENTRYVPTGKDSNGYVIWEDDKIDISQEMSKQFQLVDHHDYYTRTDKPLTVWKKT
jgi:2-polyprenyl-3-methyl-5-hydroxy-6-metoxy-1,4-benzoquinol methylase